MGKYNSQTAPVGAVLIYSGGLDGHIEIKVDNDSYCSDYCTDHPRDTSPTRKLIAVYMPQKTS